MTATPPPTLLPQPAQSEEIYNKVFWLAYVANFSLVTANALTFRFAEFVSHLGGSEQIAGAVVSAGTIGALLVRLVLGQSIDRYGTRLIWLLSSLLFIAGCILFLLIQGLSVPLYAARIAFAAGMAGMFTCSVVHIQNQVPSHRRIEVIGSLGSSGFLGIIAGSQLSDWMLAGRAPTGSEFLMLFGTTVVLGCLYLALVLYLTRGDEHIRPHETPGAHRLIFRHWPGSIVLVAIMMGVGFTSTTVFLTRFATELNLRGVGTFFTGYAVTAFIFRISSRRWSDYLGYRGVAVLGLMGHFFGNAALPFVSQEWHFILPAMMCGFGHALLFPVVVSVGSGAFPREYRGTGTTLVFGFVEVGAMISAPILGGVIDHFGFQTMYFTTAGMALFIAAVYSILERKQFAAGVEESASRDRPLGAEPTHGEFTDDELEEPAAIPFPQLGRSA